MLCRHVSETQLEPRFSYDKTLNNNNNNEQSENARSPSFLDASLFLLSEGLVQIPECYTHNPAGTKPVFCTKGRRTSFARASWLSGNQADALEILNEA